MHTEISKETVLRVIVDRKNAFEDRLVEMENKGQVKGKYENLYRQTRSKWSVLYRLVEDLEIKED